MSSELYLKALPSQFTIKGYITGDEAICNYELYLTDFINNASHFMVNHHERFTLITEQSFGEPDVISGDYSLDFKLFDTQSHLESSSVLKSQITKMPDGWTAYSIPKQEREMRVTRAHTILRSISFVDFNNDFSSIEDETIKHDLIRLRKVLLTKKNLLLFFPYKLFHHPALNHYKEGFTEVFQWLNHDFGVSLEYRNSQRSQFDTYFSTIYEDYFVLAKEENNTLSLLDIVPLEVSEVWDRLLDYEIMREI